MHCIEKLDDFKNNCERTGSQSELLIKYIERITSIHQNQVNLKRKMIQKGEIKIGSASLAIQIHFACSFLLFCNKHNHSVKAKISMELHVKIR